MHVWHLLLSRAGLVGYVAAWWLVYFNVLRIRITPVSWVPLALLAFGVPMLVADLAASTGWRHAGNLVLAGWVALPVVIVVGRIVMRLCRRRMV